MNTSIVTLKAFGDFLIAYQSVKHTFQANRNTSIHVIAGRHIQPLAEALEVPAAYVEFLGGGSCSDVPAAFDFKRQGKWAAINSLVGLRRSLAPFAKGSELVFDRLGWRERFIAGDRRPVALPMGVGNIYLAYEELLRSKRIDIVPSMQRFGSQLRSAVIVPGSRNPGKTMPAAVQAAIYASLVERNISTTVLKLDGENVDAPKDLPTKLLPRSFLSLFTALRAADLVVSADSLPAHLGEYFGLPTFVVSPTPNPYWLPKQAFLTGATASFDALLPLADWLVGLSNVDLKTPAYPP